MAVNVIAPMLLAQAAGRHMIAQGGGRIVNVASTTGVRGKPHLVGYSASKGAVVRLTEALAAEWAARNVQVNCLAPGAFRTDAQRAVLDSPDLLKRRVARIPAAGSPNRPSSSRWPACWCPRCPRSPRARPSWWTAARQESCERP